MKKGWKKRVSCVFALSTLVTTMIFSTGTVNLAKAKAKYTKDDVSQKIEKLQGDLDNLQKKSKKKSKSIQKKKMKKKLKAYKNTLKNKVIFEEQSLKILVGTEIQLETKWKYSNAYNKKVVSWTSSDKSIATVNKIGVVTAKKVGKVIITAEAAISKKKTSIALEVVENTEIEDDYTSTNNTVKDDTDWEDVDDKDTSSDSTNEDNTDWEEVDDEDTSSDSTDEDNTDWEEVDDEDTSSDSTDEDNTDWEEVDDEDTSSDSTDEDNTDWEEVDDEDSSDWIEIET